MAMVVIVAAACSSRTEAPDASTPDASRVDAGSCGCVDGIHSDHVLVLSDAAELWSFDPRSLTFAQLSGRVCGVAENPYSMAVDEEGDGHVLFVESRAERRFALDTPRACTVEAVDPAPLGFSLYGSAFTRDPASPSCDRLYLLSYSGSGPFREGAGLGVIATADAAGRVTTLASIDYDGGELTGTADGRLFAFVGATEAKLLELDPVTGAVRETVPLVGLETTHASAFAFFGGDFWIFTEAPPPSCNGCLDMHCASDHAACLLDKGCAAQLACAITAGDVSDTCGGGLSTAMQACLSACTMECLVPGRARVSQVTRVDWDGSDGPPRALTTVVAAAPMRVVGAGTSTCVPLH
jgi:hypothetical protein